MRALKRLAQAARNLASNVRGDYEAVMAYRGKYNADAKSWGEFPVDVVKKVGVQMMAAVRLMHFVRDAGVPLAPQVASRMIRHLYGADIHWDAQFAPGVSIIHGQGLIVSHGARVGEGCILFQGVTLGEGRDGDTQTIGSPVLEKDVHVGPNAVILGPVRVGEGTKIMATAVLTQSVPKNSLVAPSETKITARKQLKTNASKDTSGRGEHA
jgi:serine O-acetyltransferase